MGSIAPHSASSTPASPAAHPGSGPINPTLSLEELSRRLQDLHVSKAADDFVPLPTRIPELDEQLPGGGLGRGIHEWIGVQERPADFRHPAFDRDRHRWSPPLTLLVQLARSALALREQRARVVWIGEAVWPYPAALAQASDALNIPILDRCLFVRASRPADRLWAADLALRSRTAAVVIADGSGLNLGATRRLQLAAEAASGPCLLARPPWERMELSAAATRWLIGACPSHTPDRRWNVELLRCKGVRPTVQATRAWTLEQDRATRALRVAPDILDGSGEAQAGPGRLARIA